MPKESLGIVADQLWGLLWIKLVDQTEHQRCPSLANNLWDRLSLKLRGNVNRIWIKSYLERVEKGEEIVWKKKTI